MARLTAKQRNALPDSAFAGPDRTYPIPDAAHAANAKARAAQFAGPKLKARIDAKADKKLSSGGAVDRGAHYDQVLARLRKKHGPDG